MAASRTRLSFFGGVGEVGGNKVLLESGGSRIFLDFGMSFRQNGKFFAEFLSARAGAGFKDFWRMGLLPRFRDDLSVYRPDHLRHMGLSPVPERGLDGVLVSHAHMDHVNYVTFLRPDVPIHMTPGAYEILAAMEDAGRGKGDGEWLRYFPSHRLVKYRDREEFRHGTSKDDPPVPRKVEKLPSKPFRVGEFEVTPFPVDHSLPGAAAFVAESGDARLAYTGDLRFHGRHGSVSRTFMDEAAEHDVDALLVEGTRVQKSADEVPETEVEAQLRDAFASAKGLVVCNWPPRDVDRMVSFVLAARATGRTVVVDTKQAVTLRRLERAGIEAPRVGRDVHVFLPRKGWCAWGDDRFPRNVQEMDYEEWEEPFLHADYAVTPADLHERSAEYVWRCDFFGLHDLVDVEPPPGSTYVHSLTEPFSDEMRLDEKLVQSWLDHFGLGPMRRTHASGHVNAEQLLELIRTMNPKVVYPIHTEHPEEFRDIVERAGIAGKVVLPRAPTMEEAMKGEGHFRVP
ncbi:MAG: MBL fold metallo-hydrolase [Actinomycetota bacterium]